MRARLEREPSFLDATLLPASLLNSGYRPVTVSRPEANFVGATRAAPSELTARRPRCTDEEDFLLKSLLEWHRWFAWYPVPVMRKGKLG